MSKKETGLAPIGIRDPWGLFREFATDIDRFFDRPFAGFRWPALPVFGERGEGFTPQIDVFERDNRLVTKIDLPGIKKEDVKVEVTDGYLTISGERKTEREETKENVYRRERAYGSFYRTVPLPEGIKLEDVKATFADGVLEVSVPLPARREAAVRKVEIEEAPKAAAKPAA